MKHSFILRKTDGLESSHMNIKTILLLCVVGFLLVTTVYVSFLLRSDAGTAPTTIQKTKAAQTTYSKTLALNQSTPSPSLVPTSAASQSLAASEASSPLNVTPTPESGSFAAVQVPTVVNGTISPSPTSTLLAAVSGTPAPTEVILAKTTSTPALASTITATPVRSQTLPEAGWMKPSHLVFVFAFSMIFFSLIY